MIEPVKSYILFEMSRFGEVRIIDYPPVDTYGQCPICLDGNEPIIDACFDDIISWCRQNKFMLDLHKLRSTKPNKSDKFNKSHSARSATLMPPNEQSALEFNMRYLNARAELGARADSHYERMKPK